MLVPADVNNPKKDLRKGENPTLKYGLPLASMLLLAFLTPGQAQEPDEMPAELEISLDGAAKLGLGYHISGTIPLQLPDGDAPFVVKTRMRAYWRLIPVQRKCRLNVAFIPLQVAGRRNQNRLTLALSLAPQILRPACGDDGPIATTPKFMVNTGHLNSTEFTLFVADGSNDERTVEDSSHLGKVTGKVALHLACPVRLGARESVPAISVLPTDTVPWPLLFDNSKTSEELRVIINLTNPRQFGIFVAWKAQPNPRRPYSKPFNTSATNRSASMP